MTVLVVSTFPSHPVNAGNTCWINAQCMLLQKMGHDVHFLYVKHPTFHPIKDEWTRMTKMYWGNNYHEYALDTMDWRVISWRSRIRRKFGIRDNHWYCDSAYPIHLSRFVRKMQREQHFDACIVQYFFLTKLFNDVKFPKTAVATHDRFGDRNIIANDPNTMYISKSSEAKAMNRCQYVLALQENERLYFQDLAPRRTVLNVYSYYQHIPSEIIGNKNAVILSGACKYNLDGVKWFIDNVLPKLVVIYPDFRLVLGGSICNALSEYRQDPHIKMLGFVDDPKDLYSQGDIAINPVSEGTGLKIKTFEAIQFDKVTIVHPHSTDGIFERESSPLLVAETVEEWVEAFQKVWKDVMIISSYKTKNKRYLDQMQAFVTSQYGKFLK